MLCHQGGEILLHNIPRQEGEIVKAGHGLRQHRVEPVIQLHGYHLSGPAAKLLCQGADAGAYLQYAGVLVRAAGIRRVPGHPVLNEEILPHALAEAEPVAQKQRLYIVSVAQIHPCTS